MDLLQKISVISFVTLGRSSTNLWRVRRGALPRPRPSNPLLLTMSKLVLLTCTYAEKKMSQTGHLVTLEIWLTLRKLLKKLYSCQRRIFYGLSKSLIISVFFLYMCSLFVQCISISQVTRDALKNVTVEWPKCQWIAASTRHSECRLWCKFNKFSIATRQDNGSRQSELPQLICMAIFAKSQLNDFGKLTIYPPPVWRNGRCWKHKTINVTAMGLMNFAKKKKMEK